MGKHTAGMDGIADVLGAIVMLAVITTILLDRFTTTETVYGPILDLRGKTNHQAHVEELGTSFTQAMKAALQGA